MYPIEDGSPWTSILDGVPTNCIPSTLLTHMRFLITMYHIEGVWGKDHKHLINNDKPFKVKG